jgi:DNA-binding HxlR family transcriptional regulator
MVDARTYGDPCGIARALDLVGERWALLVVRELLLGPKRFTDLRAGLPGASPNVLSQRLRELEDAAVVARRKLAPPAAAWVYELTRRGRELEPLLLELGRWGGRGPSRPGARPAGPLGTDALMVALKATFDARAARGLRATCELRLGEDRFRLAVSGARLELRRGGADDADAIVTTDAATLRSLVFRRRTLAAALRAGDVAIEGDRRAAARLLHLFPPPARHADD